MFGVRSFIVASIAMISGIAAAQFDGPAPLAWRWQQPSSVSPTGTPLVEANTIYFNLGNRVYAIDRDSGNMKWKFPGGAPSPGIFRRSPVMVNGILCAYNDQREVYGIDPVNGQLKFVYQAPYPISSQIVAVGNNVAFSMDGGNISAVDTNTGQSAYIDKTTGAEAPLRVLDGIRGSIFSDGKDVIAFFDNRNTLEGLSLSTRKQVWKQPFGATPPDGSMTTFEGYFYVYTGAYMACLNAFSGSVKWQVPVTERMMFSPEVGGGLICAVSQSGNAYFFDLNGAAKSKAIAIGSQPAVRPTCVGKKFVIPTANGSLQLVDPNGSIDWQYYIRPMNEAARQANSSSTGAGKGNGGGAGAGTGFGGAAGGAPGGPGGRQGSSNADNSPIVTVSVAAQVALAGHTLLVPAADASLLAFDIENGVDLNGPDVKQIWPGPGEIVSGKSGQEFIFKIEDEASGVNISSVKVDIDGAPYHFDFGRDGYLIFQVSQLKRNPMISNGRHTIHIVARDWMGNETTLAVTIRVDNSLDPLKRPGSETNGTNPGGGGGKGKGGGGAGLGGGAG